MVHVVEQQLGSALQTPVTQGDSQPLFSALPWTQTSWSQGPGYSAVQQVGSALQIFCTQGLQVRLSAPPAAHGLCEHATLLGLSQN